jgi:hypothetical protein
VEYVEKGAAALHPKVLQPKLNRLLKNFAKAGIDAHSVIARAVALS